MSVGATVLLVFLILVYIALSAFLVIHYLEEHECPIAKMSGNKFVLKASDHTNEYDDVFDALQEWEKVYPHCPLPHDWINYHERSETEQDIEQDEEEIEKDDDNTDQVEFEEPPDDDPSIEGFGLSIDYDYYPYHPPTKEDFRIIRTSPTSGQLTRARGSGTISTRGRGGYHKTSKTRRRFPRMFRRRPWKTYWWRTYPSYIQTYPLTFYDDAWEVPVERFSIRIGPKSFENPDAGGKYLVTKGSATNCGVPGADINLIYGNSYEFDIFTSIDCITGQIRNEPFVFTTHPISGEESEDYPVFNLKPTVNGVIKFTVTNDTPQKFYYQSTNGSGVGGTVYVHY